MRIGLTGGIGSGKSTAAVELSRLGAIVIDTDALAREITASGGAAIESLTVHFGDACLDTSGALDRQWMRQHAFAHPDALRSLESILHPLISVEADRRARAHAQAACIVFDVPLLVETDTWRRRVDRVLVIDCTELTQRRRVARRAGWSEADAERVMARQAPRTRRRAAADAVIDNDTDDIAQLQDQLAQLWNLWVSRSI